MKQRLLFSVLMLLSVHVFSQNTNPYSVFGYHSEIEYKLPMDKLFRIKNTDTVSPIKAITIDFENSLVYFLGEYDVIVDTAHINPDDILIWLSVDPLADKYPSFSPYVYCANNPIRYWDPDGRWIPGLDDNGNVTYTAEKGDNLYTFQRQFGVGKKEALGIFNQSKMSATDDASFEAGQHVINGNVVKEHTGSDVLKGQWHNMTDNQKAAQIMFGMLYGKEHNLSAENGAYAININDFIHGFYVPENGLRLNNITIPVKGGTIPLDHMTVTSSSAIGSLIFHGFSGGDSFTRNDGSSFYRYSANSAKNPGARNHIPALIIAVPSSSDNKFRNSY